MMKLLENSVRVPTVFLFLALALVTSVHPGAAVAQEPCQSDADCADQNPCRADLCATTTNQFYLSFDGNADVVTVPTADSLNPIMGITLSVWIRLDAMGTRQAIIDKAYASETEPYYQYHLEVRPNGALYFALAVNGVRKFVETAQGFGVSAGVWQHVAGTWDGTTMRLYRNGAEFWSTTSAPGNLSTYSRGVYIGNNYNAAMDLAGRVDEVAIYGRGLSAEEVRDLMRRGYRGDPELRGRWAFDEGSGSSTSDSSGLGNHATISSALWEDSDPVSFGTEDFCFYPPMGGIACDDGLWCTTGDSCVDGACIETVPRDCEDGIFCTINDCDEAIDSCYAIPSDTDCNDGLECTEDTCDVAVGCIWTPNSCDDLNPCTDDRCQESTPHCFHVDNCDDSDFCNGVAECVGGTCRPGTPLVGEVTHLRVYWSGTYTLLVWDQPFVAFYHDLAVGSLSTLRADGGTAGATCLADNLTNNSYEDARPAPEPGTGEYYMVRMEEHSCVGTWGHASDGTERLPMHDCP